MKLVIQHNLLSARMIDDVRHAVQDLPHIFVGLVPFSREITSNDPIIGTDYIPYGSTSFVETAEGLGWRGLCFDRNRFSYLEATEWRGDMLNGERIMRAEDALVYAKKLPPDQDVFLRPSHDLKQFSGAIYTAKDASDYLTDAMINTSSGTYKIEPDLHIVISEPKHIVAEWRWFIVGGKVVDGSWYRLNGELVKTHVSDPELIAEAQKFADGWLPHQCCVMDICELADQTRKVIEFNCINGSGFYGHDIKKIMQTWHAHMEVS